MSAVPDIPDPELNPLINPLLGRNLARWAQVYLTTPPEQREAAIADLLRQLRAEEQGALADTSDYTSGAEPAACPKCGHQSLPDAKFCGLCGASLMDGETFLVDSSQPPVREHFVESRPAPSAFPVASSAGMFAAAPRPAPIPAPAPELPSFAPTPPPPASSLDVSWMRERNLFGAPDEDEPRSYAKYLVALFAVLLVAGGFLYFRANAVARLRQLASAPASEVTAPATPAQSKPASPSGAPAGAALNAGATSAPQPAAATPSTVTPSTVNPPAAPTPSAPASHASVTKVSAANEVLAPAKPSPAPQTGAPGNVASAAPSPAATPAAGSLPVDDGSAELAVAEDYLEGRKHPRDAAAAAQLLWKAVGKQNNTAILLLSDLYVTGDGVPQSCDQARILLTAAARRNVKAAVDRLNNLSTSCH